MNHQKYQLTDFLPTTLKEVQLRDWDELDVILFTGDAYVDHPAFGAAVIGRILEHEGFRVAIVPQPNWKDDLRDFKKLGKPRLFFGITSGNMDSMVNHYTANRRLRSDDAYTPGGQAGFRPDNAVVVYSNILKKLFPETPVVLGGIEASLRRLTYYDYWEDCLRPGILCDSNADLLIYGNGENAVTEIARLLAKGVEFPQIQSVPQTCFLVENDEKTAGYKSLETRLLHSHEECLEDKLKFAENFKHIEIQSNKLHAKRLIQKVQNKHLIVNPPYVNILEKEADKIYDLPYTRQPHPKYEKRGKIAAFEMIKFSVNTHRGCFGGCSFCTISAHQGKFIINRSEKSILAEVDKITEMPDFKGHITDLGGPSANMYRMQGLDLTICDSCERPSCIFPKICKNLNTNHDALTDLYQKVRKNPAVKMATIGSGIRYDLLIDKENQITGDKLRYAEELIKYHVSGRLKIAPEHTTDRVLTAMRKPSFKLFHVFKKLFDKINRDSGTNQQLIPYFISSHPGSTDEDMAELALETKNLNFRPEQVQDLTPTPLTAASVMYYAGVHPYTLEKIYTARTKDEKLAQRMFFFWYKSEFRNQIIKRLSAIGRKDIAAKLFSK